MSEFRALWGAALSFAISAVGVSLALRYSRRTGIVDIPNARSSHSVPTPRGGGVAIVAAVLVVSALELGTVEKSPNRLFVFLGTAVVLLTSVGWLDDRGSMPVRLRLWAHVACGIPVALLVNRIAPLPGSANIAWLAWWFFWTVSSINIVNFMDGIDGMVASQGVVYGLFLSALLPSDMAGARFGLILAAACLGFLVWNWAPAKIFMGDAGSGPLGLFFVIGGALALQGVRAPLVFVPLYPLYLDALMTLIRRFRRGEKLTAAHRSHLYQRLANERAGHAVVTLVYALAAAIGALVAVSVTHASGPVTASAILAYCITVATAWKLTDRRFPGPAASLSAK